MKEKFRIRKPPLWVVIVAMLLGIVAWAINEHIEISKQQEIARGLEEKQRSARALAEQEQAKIDAQKAAEVARAKRAEILAASDDSLRSLIRDCQRKINEKITSSSKPAFAVYFPKYSAADLASLTAFGASMKSQTGRPSVLLDDDRHEERQLEGLRRGIQIISIIAESASDSFSGVKRWAAEYRCTLDGLSVASAESVGPRHFF